MASIVIIDDHHEMVDMLAELLKLSGYSDIATFTNQDEAEAYIHASSEPPVIITDYNMPGLTGPQLLIRIKKSHPDTQGLIITSEPREASLDEDTKGFPIVDKNRFTFFDEINDLVRDFMNSKRR